MRKIIGIISSNYRSDFLQGLTKDRPMAAIPFGGRYRLLDFALSSMVISGIRTVGIITPCFCRPILDHLGAGKDWYLDRKSGGMFLLPGSNYSIYSYKRKFSLTDLRKNIEFLEKDLADTVIISGSSFIYNLDYSPILDSHEENKADITMVYKELDLEPEENQGVVLQTDSSHNVLSLEEIRRQNSQRVKYFAEIFIIGRKMLLDIIRGYQNIDYMDLLDFIRENLKVLTVQAYPITGYLGRIYSIESYYQRNMDMLTPAIRKELFLGVNRVHTRIKDNPPTKYGPQGSVKDSLVSSGCLIEGNIKGSIIFRGVEVQPGAHISNSIIMQRCSIGKEAILENVILDKFVRVASKVVLKGNKGVPVFINKASQI